MMFTVWDTGSMEIPFVLPLAGLIMMRTEVRAITSQSHTFPIK